MKIKVASYIAGLHDKEKFYVEVFVTDTECSYEEGRTDFIVESNYNPEYGYLLYSISVFGETMYAPIGGLYLLKEWNELR